MTWPTKDDFVDGDVLTAAQVNNIADNLNLFDPTSATNGQVWFANGSGSGAYATPASGSMTLITSGSLASMSTIIISSIPGTYKHLQLHLKDVYASTTGASIFVEPNNEAFAHRRWMASTAATPTTAVDGVDISSAGGVMASTLAVISANTGTRTDMIVNLYFYADTSIYMKQCDYIARTQDASNNLVTGLGHAAYFESAAITSIELVKSGAPSITAGDYYLWGIK
jgi:hypothetical protein